MCGISVVYDSKRGEQELEPLIKSMMRIQRHRGEDNQGTLFYDHLGMGHVRLSIQDLSERGNQPMVDPLRRAAIVYNGEIYNYKNLRQDLINAGESFISTSDTEVILKLYLKKGIHLLEMLNGAFAFAIYDFRTKELFCARDRVGEKPFLYTEYDRGFACASEIPALKLIPNVDLSYDRIAIGIYLLRNMRHIPAPYTIYKGIRKLEAGHAIIVKQGRIVKKWKYWGINFSEKIITVDILRSAIDKSIKSRLVSDVPVGAMLSGGVDSSAVVYGMSKLEGLTVNTYALGLDKDDSDLARARTVSSRLGTNHKEFYFDPLKQYTYFNKLLSIYGEPIMLLPLLHAYEICEHIKDDGIKVVMSGNGADELFYGYDGDNNLALLTSLMNTVPQSLLLQMLKTVNKIHKSRFIENAISIVNNKPGYRKSALYNQAGIDIIAPLIDMEMNAEELIGSLTDLFIGLFNKDIPYNYIDEANVVGLFIENEHSITISADLSSMAAGIEARAPFLDHELIELAWQINYKQKIPSYTKKEKNKWIFKQALKGRIDDDILFAKKQGFGYNISEEKTLRGPWKKEVERTFRNPGAVSSVLNMDNILQLKRKFDEYNTSVSAMIIAKLFALLHFEQV